MSPLELVGDFDAIAKELRSSRPVASVALRERVAALGGELALVVTGSAGAGLALELRVPA